jgi:hypothetical protein
MKFELTQQAAAELEAINKRIDDAGDDNYEVVCESLNERELLVADAGLYVNEAYVDNKFNDLDVWCQETGEGEVPSDFRMRVKKNIGKMLIEDIITIVE